MKIKKILVTQPRPETEKSPYFDLAEKYSLKIDFRPFIQVEPVTAKEFRQTKANLCDFTAVIFTSKTAITHFFKVCEDMKYTVPDTMKYFCISESTAFFLQKYIVYRKRKIFYANGTVDDLIEIIKKHAAEKIMVPVADNHKDEIPVKLEQNNINFSKIVLYKTVISDLSDLIKDFTYDIIVFFSPSGITSLTHNFPKFKQNETKIAAFGPTTAKAVQDAGFRLDIQAPQPEAPSMTMALERFLKASLKTSKK